MALSIKAVLEKTKAAKTKLAEAANLLELASQSVAYVSISWWRSECLFDFKTELLDLCREIPVSQIETVDEASGIAVTHTETSSEAETEEESKSDGPKEWRLVRTKRPLPDCE